MWNTSIIETRDIFITVLLVLAIISSLNGDKDVAERTQPLVKKSKYNYFVRCTRRFTPGLCLEQVVSVWTFAFHTQNCTERFGCPQDWRANRFTTHARCMRRCKPLVDFYTEILSRESHNLSAYIRSQPWNKSARRDSGDDESFTDVQDDYDTSPVGGTLHRPAPVSDATAGSNWAMTYDIDDVHVESVFNRDDFKH